MLPYPIDPEDGADTIVVLVYTGMFAGEEYTDEDVIKVLLAIAKVIFDFFDGTIEVEAFEVALSPTRKVLLKVQT